MISSAGCYLEVLLFLSTPDIDLAMAHYHIRNATVVSMDGQLGVQYNCDVLIEDGAIKAVGQNLDGAGAETIDGSDCIVSPGFVDGHRHMWQTQLAGLLSDMTLVRINVLGSECTC